MKRLCLLLLCGTILLSACSKNDKPAATDNNTPEEQPATLGKRCASMEVLQEQLRKDPSLAARMARIEHMDSRRYERRCDRLCTIPWWCCRY
ncbi:hypothetical protein [Chitinophaga sp. YR627]|uniref:hypothetical protein n=1 Tax=Chitinophaga sp. YR627 TaxID=1881041 RepID=UPI0015A6A1F8|nr:hypothetical protein [Chitinophaga sp. YR627]